MSHNQTVIVILESERHVYNAVFIEFSSNPLFLGSPRSSFVTLNSLSNSMRSSKTRITIKPYFILVCHMFFSSISLKVT